MKLSTTKVQITLAEGKLQEVRVNTSDLLAEQMIEMAVRIAQKLEAAGKCRAEEKTAREGGD